MRNQKKKIQQGGRLGHDKGSRENTEGVTTFMIKDASSETNRAPGNNVCKSMQIT